jgi:hypothetical protein
MKITGSIKVNTHGDGIYEATVNLENASPREAIDLLESRLREIAPDGWTWDED